MSALDEYTRSLMSPSELEAIEDPNYDTGEESDTDADDGDEGEQTAQPVEGAEPKEPEPEAPTAKTPAPVQDEAIKTDKSSQSPAADEPEVKQQFVPRYEAALPSDYQEKLEQLATKEADLKAKLKAGDIDFDAYDAERDGLSRERSALERAAVKAEISQEMTQQTAQQRWQSTISGFLSKVKGELDYASDPQKLVDLDGFVKILANNPAYDDKSAEWFLSESHRRVQALHGLSSASSKDAPSPTPSPKQTIDKAKAARKPAVSVQSSLAQIPGGDGPGDVSDEFVDVDSLDGFEQEEAIRRMSPAQRDRYLKSI